MSQNVHWRQYQSSNSTHSRSDSSGSYDTAPTEYSDRRPSLPHSDTCHARVEGRDRDYFAPENNNSSSQYAVQPAHASVETYASTSEEDLADDFDDIPEYEVPQHRHQPRPNADATPTTPRDFGDLFPTAKRISIRHDDSTIDGNMNLRIDTQVEDRNHNKQDFTLFHLRMKDLRTREFSLRRYCRDSGREVCHSIRKYQNPPPEQRPILQRASTALANLVHKPESRPSTSASLKRSDSGYESVRNDFHEDDDDSEDYESRPKSVGYSKGRALMPTNTIKLEFSNYAHLDVKRRGAKSNKRYAFEHWGNQYSWKRVVKKEHDQESISYYLIRNDNDKEPLAHICPVRLSADESHEETARGGWVPPSYMRITDNEILCSESDISDVVVATGLMALVDDCIKRRFSSKQSTQLHIPLLRNGSFKMNMEYIGPKRLIDEVFNRNTGSPKKQSSSLRRTYSD